MMPAFGHPPVVSQGHDWCLATFFCRNCGASQAAVAAGVRAASCEPGVTGISWRRCAERFRDLMAPWANDGDNFRYAPEIEFGVVPSPEVKTLPLYRMSDFARGQPLPFKPEDPSAA
jgi:hypothetical protein